MGNWQKPTAILPRHHHHHFKSLLLLTQTRSQAEQCHAHATVKGLLPHHLPTLTTVMLAYATHNDANSSHLLFHHSSTHQRHNSSFLHNTLLRCYAKAGLHHGSFLAYNSMRRAGVLPDNRTFPYVLTACADAGQIGKGMEVHGSVFRFGLGADVFVGNTLVALYGTCGDVEDAQKVFDEMGLRDVVTWNSMISVLSANGLAVGAMECFVDLVRTGLEVNSISIVGTLPACVLQEDGEMGQAIHGYVVKVGMDSLVTVGNTIVDMYAKCGDPEASMRFFSSMVEKNDVSWNSIIGCYVHIGRFKDALCMFRAMVAEEMKSNSVTLSSLLPALIELGCFDLGRELHAYSMRKGMDKDVFVANSLLDLYAKYGHVKEALAVFSTISSKNVVSWNIMIANFTQNMGEREAVSLIREMQADGEYPNAVTFTNVLPACSRLSLLKHGKEIHAKSIHIGCCYDLFVSNALIDMYAKCGRLNLSRNIFNLSRRDEVSYNTLIVGYSQSQYCWEALHLFLEMGLIGLRYDEVSFMGSLAACANMSAIKQGKEIHCMIIKKLFHNHLFVANSLLDLYTKGGQMSIAKRVFDQILIKDVASWNSMILGYAMQGEHDRMFSLFELMKYENVNYDSVSYIAILSACSHGGLVKKGKKYFEQMLSQKIEPTQTHYACMVDLLGRAGLMKEAAKFIDDMPFQPDSNVWGALLGACRVYGNLEYGRLAAENLFRLKPEHSGYYTLLSNMYAEAGRWDEAVEIRERMKKKGVKKNPGYSWLDAGDKMHAFVVGEPIDERN